VVSNVRVVGGWHGITASCSRNQGRLLLDDVEASGATFDGIRANQIEGTNIVANNNGSSGIRAERSMEVYNVIANGNDFGIWSSRSMKLYDVIANENSFHGIVASGSVKGENIETSRNRFDGIRARSARITNATTNENGVVGVRLERGGLLVNLDSRFNVFFGLASGGRVRLTDSTLLYNDHMDIIVGKRCPLVQGTLECGLSSNSDTGGTCGICTND
jgi:hypothetical protein